MDEDNSTRLAEVYNPKIIQTIAIYPYLWKHYGNNGNWFLVLNNLYRGQEKI